MNKVITMKDELKDLQEQQPLCKNMSVSEIPCGLELMGKKHCYVSCILRTRHKSDAHLLSMRHMIVDTADTLCKPIGTAYDRLMTSKDYRTHFSSYKNFLKLLEINEKTVKTRINHLISTFMGNIIGYTSTPYSPLSLVIKMLREYVVEKSTNTFNLENNPTCMIILPHRAYMILTEAFAKDASLQNVLLQGFFMINTVTKYLSTKSSLRYTAMMELHRLFTGSIAGFGCSAKSSNTNGEEQDVSDHSMEGLCDDLGKAPSLGFPIPPVASDGKKYFSISKPACYSESTEEDEVIKLDLAKTKEEFERRKKSKRSSEVKVET